MVIFQKLKKIHFFEIRYMRKFIYHSFAFGIRIQFKKLQVPPFSLFPIFAVGKDLGFYNSIFTIILI